MFTVVSAFRRTSGSAKAGHYILIALLATTSIVQGAEKTLVDAAEQGDRATALRLLAKGANPNATGADGTTAIMWAASNDDVELVRALVRAGAKVTLKNQLGTSAL